MNTFLPGLGCPECGGTCAQKPGVVLHGFRGLGDVANYDQITVGGKRYSVGEIMDKTMYAENDVPVYSKTATAPLNWKTPAYIVKKGQAIGRVFSYLKPSTDHGAALMFYPKTDGASYYYVIDNDKISSSAIKEQGVQTVAEQVKEEQDKKLREDDPVGYYLKKYGLPALLIIGGIIIVGKIGGAAVSSAIARKKEA